MCVSVEAGMAAEVAEVREVKKNSNILKMSRKL